MAGNGNTQDPRLGPVNTWDRTITVTTGNAARGNAVTKTIPNPNYIDRTVAPAPVAAAPVATVNAAPTAAPQVSEFQRLLTAGVIKPVYGQMDVSKGQSGASVRVDDPSKFQGYVRDLGNGTQQIYDVNGTATKIAPISSGGFSLGGLLSDIGGAVSNVTSGVSDAVSTVGKDVASNPALMAAITAVAATAGVPPQVTAAILGANRGGQDGNLLAGLETAALSYGLGNTVAPGTSAAPAGATTAPVTSGVTTTTPLAGTTAAGGTTSSLLPNGLMGTTGTGGLTLPAGAEFTGLGLETTPLAGGFQAGGGVGLKAASTIGSAISKDLAANSLAPSLGATGMLGAAQAATPSILGGSTVASSLIPGVSDGLLSTGLNLVGGLIQGDKATSAAQTNSDAIIKAAQIAADAAKFKPVGVTTGFGSSKFGYDANGNLTSAGYDLTPQMKAQRDALLGSSDGLLKQFQGSQAATAGMSDAAKRAMTLGNSYLATDPQAQAQKYLNDQLGLLAPQRAQEMAALQAQMQAQGRGGFAIGGGVGGQGAANPQLQAFLNAQMQQNNQLAADATRGGMDYAKFGAGMVGTGGDLLSSMYGTQTASFDPYKTALGGAQTVEGLGQNALTQGISLGSTNTAANAAAGNLLASGMKDAATTMAPANAYSPWANLLGGGAQALQQYKFGQ